MRSLRQWWARLLRERPWLNFGLAGLFFMLFGFSSVNLFVILHGNIRLFIDHGLMVIADGALQQLLELAFNGYLSVAFFVLYKTCETALVKHLMQEKEEN